MICIVGGGPACIALLCCMIKNNIFDALKEKILILEASSEFGSGAFKNYQIRSNSSLSSILEIVPDFIRQTWTKKTQTLVKSIGHDTCYLPIIGSILEETGQYFSKHVRVLKNTKVIKITKDSVYTEHTCFKCSKIITCIGGSLKATNISSQSFLSGKEYIVAKHILIVGGSHSAWSVAWKLIQNRFKGKITMYSRSKIKVYCVNEDEAKDINYTDYDTNDICPDTRGIFRFAGLRGDSKTLWLNRHTIKNFNIVHEPVACDTIIQAYGYQPNIIEGVQYSARFGFMCGIQETSGEPSFKKSKDGIWIYGHTLGKIFLQKHFKELF